MRTGVKVDKSPDGDDSRQVQETVGKTSDNERTVPCDNKGGGGQEKRGRTACSSMSPLCKIEIRNTMDNVEQSINGISRTSYKQSSRKVKKGY